MTRRVSESTPQKKAAQGVWGVEDLRKRPAPTLDPTASMQFAYMLKSATQTIATASTTNLTGYASGGSVDAANITTDETNGKFTISATGLYLAQLVTIWTTSFNFGKMARISLSGGNVLQDTNYWTQWVSEEDAGLNLDQVTCEALFFVDNVSTQVLVQGVVRQLSGSDKDISGVDFSIVRLAPYA